MHRLIIQIRTNPAPEMLLLIKDIMLNTRNNTRILRPDHRLRHSHTTQIRIGAEALPIATAGGIAPERPHHGSELDIDALIAELGPEGVAPPPPQITAERRGGRDPRYVHGVQIRVAHAVGAVLQTDVAEAQTGHRARVARA